jgi:hypothetical protein
VSIATKSEMADMCAVNVEAIRVRILSFVALGGSNHEGEGRSDGKPDSVDLYLLSDCPTRSLHGALIAKGFLDDAAYKAGIVAQLLELLRVCE